MGAVQNSLQRAGLDPSIMELDHGKSLLSQMKANTKHVLKGFKLKPKPKVRRKKVFLNKVNIKDGTVWSEVKKSDVKLKLEHSLMEEFEQLFSQAIDSDKEKKNDKETKDTSPKAVKTVKVIE